VYFSDPRCVDRLKSINHDSVFCGRALEHRNEFANGDKLPILLRTLKANRIVVILVLSKLGKEAALNDQAANIRLLQMTAHVMRDLRMTIFDPIRDAVEIPRSECSDLFVFIAPLCENLADNRSSLNSSAK
jgi:hypothetical protein